MVGREAAARGRRIAKVGERRWRQVFLARTQELGDGQAERAAVRERKGVLYERLAEGPLADECRDAVRTLVAASREIRLGIAAPQQSAAVKA